MNTIHKLLCSGLLLLPVLSTPAWAEYEEFRPYFYYGIGVGKSNISHNTDIIIQNTTLSPAATIEDSYSTWKIYGGYQFDPLLGLEMSVPSLGDSIYLDNGNRGRLFTTSGVTIEAVLNHEISDAVTAYGKLGMFAWSSHIDAGQTTINQGTDLTYGLGLDVNLYGNRDRSMRIEYQRYELDNVYISSVDTLTIGLHLRIY